MIAINLLDWRGKKVTILNRRYFVILAVVIAIWLVIAMFIYMVFNSQINTLNDDIAYLDTQEQSIAGALVEISNLQAERDSLLTRRKTIEMLQASRSLVVTLFDNIVRVMPDGVILTEMSRKGAELVLSGVSDTNYSITVLMENVQRLPWVKTAQLGELKAEEDKSSTAATKNIAAPAVNQANKISFQLHLFIDSEKTGVSNAPSRN